MNFGISEKTLEQIKNTLASYPEINEALVFGSRAMGHFKPGSDIDLALKGDELSPETVLKIKHILNERLPIPYTFDVVDYTHLDHVELKNHIDQYGKLIYPLNFEGVGA